MAQQLRAQQARPLGVGARQSSVRVSAFFKKSSTAVVEKAETK
jgi:hypothetical protein